MPENPFLLPSIPPLAPMMGANPFLRQPDEEPDRGFLGTLIHETGRDLTGFGRTLVAPIGSLAEAIGLEAPVTWDDLSTRDLTGAGMVASMFVGGLTFGAAKSVLAGQGLKALGRGAGAQIARREAARFAAELGFVRRAGLAAGAEGAAGAFFGAVKPLDSEESRLEAVLDNSALFAGFGGAFSMLGSGVKATVGQRLALLKGQHRTQLLAQAAQQESSRQFLQEFAGVRLRAPETGSLLEVKRLADGTVQTITKTGDSAVTQTFDTFGSAVAHAFESGHTERLGVARTKLALDDVSHLDEGILKRVSEADGDIAAALGQLEFGGYKAARDLIAKHRESDLLLDWLGVETVTERMGLLGEAALDPRVKQQMLSLLPRTTAARLGALSDSDFLREAMKHGVVDVMNIADATQARTFLKELAANEYIPDAGFVIAARSTYDATFLSGLVSSRTLAKVHPELQPFVDLSLQAAATQSKGQTKAETWLQSLLDRVPKAKAEIGVRILDESQQAGNVLAARTKALAAAQATGDAQVIDFVQSATERLNHYRLRAIGAGRLGSIDLNPEKIAGPSITLPDGRVIQGRKGEIHAEILTRVFGESRAEELFDVVERGFFTDRGRNVTREEAHFLATGEASKKGLDAVDLSDVLADVAAEQGPLPTPEAIATARQIIAQAADEAADGLQAENLAFSKALATDDPLVYAAVERLLDNAGRAGYFPIVNVGGYYLSVNGERFGGLYKTMNDALKAAKEAGGTAFISPAMTADSSTLKTLSGKEFGRLAKAIESAEGVEVTGGVRKYSGHLQPRKLGIRDFAEDPFSALRFYTANMERTLAYNLFEQQAEGLISNIPGAKRGVQAWAKREADLLLGRPTWAEDQFQSIVESLGLQQQVGPRALKSMSSAIRHFQSAMKLGGVWAGAVNSTQYATATVAKLGAKYSAIGLEAILVPSRRAEALALLKEGNIDLGLHSFAADGSVAALDSVKTEFKSTLARIKLGEGGAATSAGLRTLENMWMYAFSGAERMNRLGTFYGAYRKAFDEMKMTKEAALSFAHDMVLKTQFDYSPANTPQLLAGPVGSVLGQFKSFFVHEIEMIAQMTPKERLKLMATFQALGGLSTLLDMPGTDLIDSASRFMFDEKLSESLRIAGGNDDAPALTRYAAFGLPGLRGIDLSSSVGPGGIADLTRGWMGPAASDIGAYAAFMGGIVRDNAKYGEVRPETWNAFWQKALPAQARRIMLGLDIIDSGEVRSPYTQKLTYRPEERLRVGVLQAIGAPTTRLTQERMMDEVVQRKIDSYREARASYRQQVALAFLEGRNDEAQAALQRARAQGIHFRPRDLRTAMRDYSSGARERRRERTPNALRDDLLEFYSEEAE